MSFLFLFLLSHLLIKLLLKHLVLKSGLVDQDGGIHSLTKYGDGYRFIVPYRNMYDLLELRWQDRTYPHNKLLLLSTKYTTRQRSHFNIPLLFYLQEGHLEFECYLPRILDHELPGNPLTKSDITKFNQLRTHTVTDQGGITYQSNVILRSSLYVT